MASTDTTSPPHATTSPPHATTMKSSEPALEYKGRMGLVVDVALRVLLFASTFVAIIIMVTSKQTKLIQLFPGLAIPVVAKFNQSPAYIYLVVALSVACFYSIITGVLLVFSLLKLVGNSTKLQFHFLILDALLLGIVASATGAAGGVGYIGFKGNSHSGWNKVCNIYGTFCAHFAASIILSLISSITLLLLVWLSISVLSKKIARIG